MIRVVLVEDQLLVRQGIRNLLDLAEDVTVVGEAADGQEALARIDTVGYVRFASVYKNFQAADDFDRFVSELRLAASEG